MVCECVGTNNMIIARRVLTFDSIGARKVVIFDHIVRHEPYYPREQYNMGIRGPAMRPHIDVTHKVRHTSLFRPDR